MAKLILASNSPRRQQLLKDAGYKFEIRKLDVEENHPPYLIPEEIAEYLACYKNKIYRNGSKDEIIITADTIVLQGKQVLGKPLDRTEAQEMLKKLSGRTHQVITGVCISSPAETCSFSDSTEVEFEELTDNEISYYIDKHAPFDKAGAYGIQDWIGLTRIRRISGSYFNVMGLPVNMVYQVLSEKFEMTPFEDN